MRFRVIRFLLITISLFFMANPALPADQAQLKRGEYIFHLSGCKSCHTDTKKKGKLLAGGTGLKTPFGTFYGPNITPDKTHGIGKWSEKDFIQALRVGTSPNGDHYFPVFPYTTFTKMTDQGMKDLRAYIFSLPAVASPNKPHDIGFPFNIRFLQWGWKLLFFNQGTFNPTEGKSAEWNRGAYLVQGLSHCSECHTPRNILGGIDNSRYLSGTPDGPEGEPAPNITPDLETGIGKWSAADIADVINSGMLPDGDFVGSSMTDVSENLSKLTPLDLKAIVTYLKSIPAIRHKVIAEK
jgi:mono/diheme cytochrome c family protein